MANWCTSIGAINTQSCPLSWQLSLKRIIFFVHWTTYLSLIKEVAFTALKLHKMVTDAFDLRPHLYAVLEEYGWVRETVLKDHCFYDGRFKDVVVYRLLKK